MYNLSMKMTEKDDLTAFVYYETYKIKKFIKISGWLKGLEKSEDPNSFQKAPGLDPGDSITEEKNFKISNTFMPFLSIQENTKRIRRGLYKKKKKSPCVHSWTLILREV
jgi:hypothetical protein